MRKKIYQNLEEKRQVASERAKRMERLRHLMNFPDWKKLAQKYGCLNYDTLRGWGSPSGYNGLTEHGARLMVEIATAENVKSCTFDWLFHGVGAGPIINGALDTTSSINKPIFLSRTEHQQKKQILDEAAYFKRHHPDAVVTEITDNAMTPFFHVGDYVGGVKYFSAAMQEAEKRFCIIELEIGGVHVGQLMKTNSNSPTQFSLLATQGNLRGEKILFSDVELKSAAPIIWHRQMMWREK